MPPLPLSSTIQPADPSTFATSSITHSAVTGSASRPPSARGRNIRNSPAAAIARTSGSGRRRSRSIASRWAQIFGPKSRAVSISAARSMLAVIGCSLSEGRARRPSLTVLSSSRGDGVVIRATVPSRANHAVSSTDAAEEGVGHPAPLAALVKGPRPEWVLPPRCRQWHRQHAEHLERLALADGVGDLTDGALAPTAVHQRRALLGGGAGLLEHVRGEDVVGTSRIAQHERV